MIDGINPPDRISCRYISSRRSLLRSQSLGLHSPLFSAVRLILPKSSMLNLRNSAGKENIARGNGPRARRIGIGWKSCDIYDRNTVSESIQLRPEGSYLRNPTFVSASELFLLYKPDYYSLFVAANDVETGAPEFPQK
ncbi:unnamed protein product, partial [Nesidiocoris tenuis]